jgi:hypothetical protein
MWEVSKQKEETANMVTAPPNLLYLLNYFLGIICASAPRTLTAYSIINLNVDLFYKLRILHSRSLASQLQSRAGLRAASLQFCRRIYANGKQSHRPSGNVPDSSVLVNVALVVHKHFNSS